MKFLKFWHFSSNSTSKSCSIESTSTFKRNYAIPIKISFYKHVRFFQSTQVVAKRRKDTRGVNIFPLHLSGQLHTSNACSLFLLLFQPSRERFAGGMSAVQNRFPSARRVSISPKQQITKF